MIFLTDFYKPLSQLAEQAPLLRHATLLCFCPISFLDDEGSWVFTSLSPPAEPEESLTPRGLWVPSLCLSKGVTDQNSITLVFWHCLHWQKGQGLGRVRVITPLIPLELQWWKEQISWHLEVFLLFSGHPLLFLSKSPFFCGEKVLSQARAVCSGCAKTKIISACLYEKPWRRDYWLQTNHFNGNHSKQVNVFRLSVISFLSGINWPDHWLL